MDPEDIFIWPDGTWRYREECEDLTDRWLGDDFEVLYVGTPEYDEFIFPLREPVEGGPDDEYWPEGD
ncbi:TPA: hypothetical protein I8Y21_005845 [Klebsiella oxytoca]|uniref:Uncharacterized protein n=1 Tax=Klebsiella oxytoca TaxID=571 RepID=A0AAN5LF89_KLEOX|nr:hypothetical protein [Klebsiella oxytoca]